MSKIFKVNKNKLAEWMAEILPELADNEGETAWFELFRDYDEGRTYSVVMTQRDSEDEEIGNEVVAKVASIADNSGMSEYDIDFEMPYDEKTGDVWNTELSIASVSDINDGKTSVSYVKSDSDWLADQAEKIFKFIKKTHKSAELEDLQESVRRPRNRMLKESSIDWSRMPTIPQEQIDAVEDEIRQKYNTWDERTQESADIVLNALDCVNGEIESCKATKDLGEDLELIVDAIRGGGYSEISLLDLDNEIDASALEDFISDVLENQEFGVDEIDFDKETSTPFKRGLRRYSAEEEATRLNRDAASRGLRKHYTFGPFEESRRPRGRMLRESNENLFGKEVTVMLSTSSFNTDDFVDSWKDFWATTTHGPYPGEIRKKDIGELYRVYVKSELASIESFVSGYKRYYEEGMPEEFKEYEDVYSPEELKKTLEYCKKRGLYPFGPAATSPWPDLDGLE